MPVEPAPANEPQVEPVAVAVESPAPAVAPRQPSVAAKKEQIAPASKTSTPVVPPARVAKTTAAESVPVAAPAPANPEKTIIEKHDRPVTPQEQAEARYRQAAQQVGQGRNDEARATLATALSLFPGHHKSRELAAVVAMQGGQLREAQDLLTQGMQLAPQELSFARLLARIQLEQGREAQAIATLEGARSAASGDADFLSLLAALYQRAGRHDEAAKGYRETIAVRATDARAWLGLGISLEAMQDAAASEAYTRALQLGGLDANLARYASQRLAAIKK
jgi:MSHA biogenesis protein MshN